MSPQVTGVISGNEFYLELANRLTCRMTLSGVKTPRLRKGLTPENAPARLLLDGLINQQTVTVHHGHFGRNRYGKGYVEVAGTNVTRVMMASRHGVLDRDQIRPLPFQEQSGLLHAGRKARPWRRGRDHPRPEFLKAISFSPARWTLHSPRDHRICF